MFGSSALPDNDLRVILVVPGRFRPACREDGETELADKSEDASR